jgi:L-fuconolactonase
VPEETPEFLALAEITPEILGVVGWVDLTAADVADRLGELQERPDGRWLVGIRHQVQLEGDSRCLLRRDVLAGLRAVARAGLAFDLLVVPAELPAAVAAVRSVPELRFVLDHAGKPAISTGAIDQWRIDIGELASEPNVSAKLSGLLTEAAPSWRVPSLRPYSDVLVSSFCPDRVMFGSDWPVCTLRASYSEVVEVTEHLVSRLDDAERVYVFGRTATDWYGLGRSTPRRGSPLLENRAPR